MIRCENACPLGKFAGCCHSPCPELESCSEVCELSPDMCGQATYDEETALVAFGNTQLAVLQEIATIVQAKKAAEEREKELKADLQDAMERFGIKKFESDVLNLTYVAPTTSTGVDSAKLKKKYPEIFTECSKTSSKAGYVKIALKGGDK